MAEFIKSDADDVNDPYRPPTTEALPDKEPDRAGCGTWLLLIVWCLEGTIKISFVTFMLFNGPRFLGSFLLDEYEQSGLLWFTAVMMFFTIETIGPAFGVFYLIRVVRGQGSMKDQLWGIVKQAVFWSGVVVVTLIAILEIAART